jgi:hypothetical protein
MILFLNLYCMIIVICIIIIDRFIFLSKDIDTSIGSTYSHTNFKYNDLQKENEKIE